MPDGAYLGEIYMSGFNYAPRGTVPCDGRLLAVADYDALYQLIGITYGGDGITTFGVPDLRGRVPMGFGSGPGLTPRSFAEVGGVEAVTLSALNLPAHSHSAALPASSQPGTAVSPVGKFRAKEAGAGSVPYAAASNAALPPVQTATRGGDEPLPVMQPYQAVNFYMFVEGIYPPQP